MGGVCFGEGVESPGGQDRRALTCKRAQSPEGVGNFWSSFFYVEELCSLESEELLVCAAPSSIFIVCFALHPSYLMFPL